MGSSPPGHPPRVDPFTLLVHAHTSFVIQAARRAGTPKADLPDVGQQVFLALHRAIGRGLDTSRPLKGWLRTTTYRIARDYLAPPCSEREVASAAEEVEVEDTASNPEERRMTIEADQLAHEVMDELPPDLRIVLAMSDLEEMPMREIAEVLELPIGTGYTRLRAARRAFRTAWEEQRATSNAMVLPFALWDSHALLAAARPIRDAPPEFVDEVWRRLVDVLGPGLAGAGAAGTAVAAGTATAGVAGAVKAGVVLTAKQVAIVAVVSALAGAGLYAALRSVPDKPEAGPRATAAHDKVPGEAPAASQETAVASVVLAPLRAPSADATTGGGTPAHDSEATERKMLESARLAIERHDLPAARATLARIKSPRFFAQRDELLRLALTYQDGGP